MVQPYLLWKRRWIMLSQLFERSNARTLRSLTRNRKSWKSSGNIRMRTCRIWYGQGIVALGIRMGQPMDLLLARGVVQHCTFWRRSGHHDSRITTLYTSRETDLRILATEGARLKDGTRTCHGILGERIPFGETSLRRFNSGIVEDKAS